MKTNIYFQISILLAAGALQCIAAEDPATGAEEFRRSTDELAATLLLDRLRAETLAPAPLADAPYAAMAAAPASYIDPEEARAALEPVYSAALAARYADAAGAVLRKLSEREGGVAFSEEFTSSAGVLDPADLAAAVKRDFPAAFSEARKRVCAEQRERFSTDIRPTEAEFERTQRAKLIEELSARIAAAQKEPVFKENLSFISSDFAEPLVAQAERQRDEQRRIVKNAKLERWTPDGVRSDIEKALESFLADEKKRAEESGSVAYGVFPSVAESIGKTSETRAEERLASLACDTEIDVGADAVARAVEANPRAHRARKDSVEAFAPELRAKLAKTVVDRACGLAADDEKAALRTWAEPLLRENGALRVHVERSVNRVLLPKIDAARAAFAESQIDRHFKPLADRSWFPQPEFADAFCEQPDWNASVRAWRGCAQLGEFAKAARENPLIEETEERIEKYIDRAMNAARTARTRQHAIVDEKFDEMQNIVVLSSQPPTLDSIVSDYTGRVDAAWKAERDETLWKGVPENERPGNRSAQHAELFGSTKDLIALKSRLILEQMKEQSKKEKKDPDPEKPKPEEKKEPQPDSPAPDMPEIVEMECRFEITRDAGDIVVKCLTDGEMLAEGRCPEERAGFRKAAGDTAKNVTSQLGSRLRDKASGGKEVSVRATLLVKDPLVYYGIVTAMSRALEDRVEELERDGITLQVGGNSGEE